MLLTELQHHAVQSFVTKQYLRMSFWFAGMKLLARAVSSPDCSLRLLDVSYNWVGPEGMKPLVEAAAAALLEGNSGPDQIVAPVCCDVQQPGAQPVQQRQQKSIQILRECLPEYWRVEAAKAAASAQNSEPTTAVAGCADEACYGSSRLATDASLADGSWCSGTCCGTAGSVEVAVLSENSRTLVEPREEATVHIEKQLWMFNTLYCAEGGLSRAPSGIAAGIDAGSNICNYHAESEEALSDLESECSSVETGSAVLLSNSNSSCEATPWRLATVGNEQSCPSHLAAADTATMPAAAATAFQAVCDAAGSGSCGADSESAAVSSQSSSCSVADAPTTSSGGSYSVCRVTWQGHQLPTSQPDQQLHTSTTYSAQASANIVELKESGFRGAAAGNVLKMVPRPPAAPSSSSSNKGAASANPPATPLVTPIPGLKTVRNMRHRVSSDHTGVSGLHAAAATAAATTLGRRGAGVLAAEGARMPTGIERSRVPPAHSCSGAGRLLLKRQHQLKAVSSSSTAVCILGTGGQM